MLWFSDSLRAGSETSSTISSEDASNICKGKSQSDSEASSSGGKRVLSLLDLYSGCGAMSTGLCLGTNLSGLKLETVSIFSLHLRIFYCVLLLPLLFL